MVDFERQLEQSASLAETMRFMSLPDQVMMSVREDLDARIYASIGLHPRFPFVQPIWEELGLSKYLEKLQKISECGGIAIPLEDDATSSMPFITAFMIHFGLPVDNGNLWSKSAVEIGSGCCWGLAILADLYGKVDGIEISPRLARISADVLTQQGIETAKAHEGDGFRWIRTNIPPRGVDTIIVSAAFEEKRVKTLLPYLAYGGRLVYPRLDTAGSKSMPICRFTRMSNDFHQEELRDDTSFVIGR